MITKEQITKLETLLGRAVRLATSIEFTINNIYTFLKPGDEPVVYQDENLNICANPKFNKIIRKAENKNFNNTLEDLENIDKEYIVFSAEWYKKLNDFREDRNRIVHEFTCGYLYHHGTDQQKLEEYQADIKRLNDFVVIAREYEQFVEKRQAELLNIKS